MDSSMNSPTLFEIVFRKNTCNFSETSLTDLSI